ncbi:hypothetical protein [Nocardia lasii]|uniref:PH domain-containing protein n=1 Tax=Nocardia lasii TaxID=1616107 RepID=A0ABW1JV44_9NOCA
MSAEKEFSYPAPGEWETARWWEYPFLAFIAGFGVFLLLQAVGSTEQSEWSKAIFFISLGLTSVLMCVHLLLLIRQSHNKPPVLSRVSVTDGRLSIKSARPIELTNIAMLLCGTVAASVFIVTVPSGEMDLPLTDGQRTFFPFFAGAALVYGVIDLLRSVTQAPIGRLIITPTEISFKRTFAGRTTLNFSDITDVTVPAGGRSKVSSVSVKCGPEGSGQGAGLDPRWPSVGAAATFWLVRFYHRHPELRDELADHRVIDRIESGGLLDPEDPKARMAMRTM